MREDRGPQGRRKLTRERAAYFELMRQGVSARQACRIVGIDRRTGMKWRNGSHAHVGKPKAVPPIYWEAPLSGRYLCEADRIHIADRLREKATVRAIAAELGRSPSTVSREIRRNRHPSNGQYRPHAAQARADIRRPVRPSPSTCPKPSWPSTATTAIALCGAPTTGRSPGSKPTGHARPRPLMDQCWSAISTTFSRYSRRAPTWFTNS